MIPLLFELYYRFFLIDLFAIGGGLATLPFLHEMSTQTGWFTYAQLMDVLAVSEATPGAIGANMSTYVGFITASLPGAVISTLGLITPSILIILVVAKVLSNFRKNPYVQLTLNSIKPASLGLICAAGFSVAKEVFLHLDQWSGGNISQILEPKALILGVLLFLGMQKWKKLHPVVFIGISAAAGIIFSFA